MKIEFTDERGIERRVIIDQLGRNPREGVPVDVFDTLDELYQDAPLSFRKALYHQLWIRGYIEPSDFNNRHASKDVMSALRNAISRDTIDIIRQITGVSS